MKKEFNHKAVMKLLFIIYMCVLVYVVFFVSYFMPELGFFGCPEFGER